MALLVGPVPVNADFGIDCVPPKKCALDPIADRLARVTIPVPGVLHPTFRRLSLHGKKQYRCQTDVRRTTHVDGIGRFHLVLYGCQVLGQSDENSKLITDSTASGR